MNSTITTTKTIWVIQMLTGDNWADEITVTTSEADAIAELGNADGTYEYRVIRRVQTNEDTLI